MNCLVIKLVPELPGKLFDLCYHVGQPHQTLVYQVTVGLSLGHPLGLPSLYKLCYGYWCWSYFGVMLQLLED